MTRRRTSTSKELILVGGGHAHAIVLLGLIKRPLPKVKVTLVSDGALTPYSGMLPGLIAGHYRHDDIHIDLPALCERAGVSFINDRVTRLDPVARTLSLRDRPALRYTLCAIDTGSNPPLLVPGVREHAMPVKPVAPFLAWWDSLLGDALFHQQARDIVIVGGGASGVEVLLAMQHRLQPVARHRYHLVCSTPHILPGHSPGVRARYQDVLSARGIRVYSDFRVTEVQPRLLRAEDQRELPFDALVWAIGGQGAAWLGNTAGIPVNAYLQSVRYPTLFAAGDVADMIDSPRPKAGVFAVRQGKPLLDNLRRAATGQALKAFHPQRDFLSLISTGDAYAVASRGRFGVAGRWVWRWKDHIDRAFMARFPRHTR